MIDLSNREQLFFTWLENYEADRGLSFQAGQLKIDWQRVFSTADSRLKLDEKFKFRLFDWVSKNIKDNFLENVLDQETKTTSFEFEPRLTSETMEKYSGAIKKFTNAVLHEMKSGSFNTLTHKKFEELKKEIEAFTEFSLLNLSKMNSLIYFDLEVMPVRKAFVSQDPSSRENQLKSRYFSFVSPKCFETKYSWLKRKAYSKSVVEVMQSLGKYYMSKSWQSASFNAKEDIIEQSYNLLKELKSKRPSHLDPLNWIGLAFDYAEFKPVYRDVRIFLNDKSACDQISKLAGKTARSRINQSLSQWISFWNLQSKSNSIPESVKLSYTELEAMLTNELDKDLELAIENYYEQIIEPLNRLIDYLFRTYLPFTLFFSGLIAFYQRANGDYFLGFTQSAILHHLTKQSFNGLPAEYPPARNGANPFLLTINESGYYDEDDEDDEFYEDDYDDKGMSDFFKYFFDPH